LSHFIARYHHALESALCREVIERFDADPRKHAGGVEGVGDPKRSVDLGIAKLPGWDDLAGTLNQVVVSAAVRYRDEHPAFARLHRAIRHTGFQIQKYRAGSDDGFDWHADVINPATANRVLAMILYLNTVEAGGETEFAAQQLAIKPEQGLLIWFPPSFAYVHRGTTPVSGPKYIVTSFLVD